MCTKVATEGLLRLETPSLDVFTEQHVPSIQGGWMDLFIEVQCCVLPNS